MQSTPVLFRVGKTRVSLNQLNNFILASNGGRFTQYTQWTEVFNQGPRQRPQLYCELRGEVQRRLVVQELYAEQSERLVPSRKPPHPRGGHQLASLAGPPVFCSESRDEDSSSELLFRLKACRKLADAVSPVYNQYLLFKSASGNVITQKSSLYSYNVPTILMLYPQVQFAWLQA